MSKEFGMRFGQYIISSVENIDGGQTAVVHIYPTVAKAKKANRDTRYPVVESQEEAMAKLPDMDANRFNTFLRNATRMGEAH